MRTEWHRLLELEQHRRGFPSSVGGTYLYLLNVVNDKSSTNIQGVSKRALDL
jgi:hypothetical protein